MKRLSGWRAGAALLACICPFAAVAADLQPDAATSQSTTQDMTPVASGLSTGRTFYVRADVGVGIFGYSRFQQDDLTANGGSFLSSSIGDSTVIGAGFGWQLNKRFRVDFTGEYHGSASVRALDNVTGVTTTVPVYNLQSNTTYVANLSSFVGLANGYLDIGTWHGFTPYVGAGIGFANNRLTGITTQSTGTLTDTTGAVIQSQTAAGFSSDHSSLHFAWALMIGTSYDLSSNAKLDIGYRFLNLGGSASASTSQLDCTCGSIGQPLSIHDLHSNEFRIGIRWLLQDPAAAPSHIPLK